MRGRLLLALAVVISTSVVVRAMSAEEMVRSRIVLTGANTNDNAAFGYETTVPAGTLLRVRLENSVGSDFSHIEDPVRARLVNPIVIDGRTVVPAGSSVLGSVTQVRRSGKVKGRGRLAVQFHTITPAGDEEHYRMSTRTWARVAPGTKKKDAATIAVPAVGGAIVGGVLGGKKGASMGAAAGGGTGTAVVLSTRGKEVRLGRGAVLAIRLNAPLTVHVS